MADLTTFTIKQHDTRPIFSCLAQLADPSRTLVNLTGASAKCIVAPLQPGQPSTIDAAATITDWVDTLGTYGTPGAVYPNVEINYVWQAGDTAVAGTYRLEIQVIFADGGKLTFPNTGYVTLTINADLGE